MHRCLNTAHSRHTLGTLDAQQLLQLMLTLQMNVNSELATTLSTTSTSSSSPSVLNPPTLADVKACLKDLKVGGGDVKEGKEVVSEEGFLPLVCGVFSKVQE